MPLALFSAATGWIFLLSLAASIGVVLGRRFILPPSSSEDEPALPDLSEPMARLGRISALLLLASLGLVFLRQLLEFRDPFVPWRDDFTLLLARTDWGKTWLGGVVVALVVSWGFHLAVRGRRWGWALATPGVLLLGAFPAFTGHANSGPLRPLTLVADTLHVWAAGGWIGGLAVVLFLDGRRRPSTGEGSESLLPRLVPRFSRLAMVCVATLLVTGVLTAWVRLESLDALFRTRYGRVLLLKLALVCGVLSLGAVNWRRRTPRLGEEGGPPALRRTATLELLLANVVLLVTAVLVRTSPLDS